MEPFEHVVLTKECRKAFVQQGGQLYYGSKQGALDMLLKRNYLHVSKRGYENSFWPSIEQRMQNDLPDGGGVSEMEFHFEASPALKALNIPERRKSMSTGVTVTKEPVATTGGYRWPVAFVLATAIAVGGFLYYQKSIKPQKVPSIVLAQKTSDSDMSASTRQPIKSSLNKTESLSASAEAKKAENEANETATPTDEPGTTGGLEKDKDSKVALAKQQALGRKTGRQTKTKPGDEKQENTATNEATKAAEEKTQIASSTVAPKKKDALDSLIDGALGNTKGGVVPALRPQEKQAPAETSAEDPSAPKTLSMNQIRQSMQKIKGLIQACYDKYQVEGKATVQLTINPEGNPSDIKVKGKFFGTDTGTCVANAVSKTQFPKFNGKALSINYPFMLQE